METENSINLNVSELDEKTIMRRLNFTDEMYDFISDGFGEDETYYCSPSFTSIGETYRIIHGYIALMVCIFGTLANILNLMILTRKEMRNGINEMLTALAFVDVLLMIEYIPFAIHMYILPNRSYSYEWTGFVLFHSHFTQILHTMSIELTLSMAIWRYIVIKYSTPSSSSTFSLHLLIILSFILPIFICIPNYLTFSIYENIEFGFKSSFGVILKKPAKTKELLIRLFCLPIEDDSAALHCFQSIEKTSKYFVDLSDLAKARGGLLGTIHFWTFSVIVKLIPCILLTYFMGFLIQTLYKAKKRHTQLHERSEQTQTTDGNPRGLIGSSTHEGARGGFSEGVSRKYSTSGGSRNRRSDRTTKLLLAVLFLFLITEFPQGIMGFLSGLYGQEFFRKCYNSFGEIWDIIALINSAINFILYAFMSKQFRIEFKKVFNINKYSRQQSVI